MQQRFKISQVNVALLNHIEQEPATAYCIAMQFQLGCSIGELIAMGVQPEKLLETVDRIVEEAVATRAPKSEEKKPEPRWPSSDG